MNANIGTPDRIARIILGVALLLAPFVSGLAVFTSMLWTVVCVVIGIVMILTALLRFCPAYTLFGINTCRR